MLQWLSAFLLRSFLLLIRIIKEELILVDLVKIDDGLFALMLPISRYVSHLLIAVGDHPNELGNLIIEAIGGVGIVSGVLLGVRFGRFLQGLLKPT